MRSVQPPMIEQGTQRGAHAIEASLPGRILFATSNAVTPCPAAATGRHQAPAPPCPVDEVFPGPGRHRDSTQLWGTVLGARASPLPPVPDPPCHQASVARCRHKQHLSVTLCLHFCLICSIGQRLRSPEGDCSVGSLPILFPHRRRIWPVAPALVPAFGNAPHFWNRRQHSQCLPFTFAF